MTHTAGGRDEKFLITFNSDDLIVSLISSESCGLLILLMSNESEKLGSCEVDFLASAASLFVRHNDEHISDGNTKVITLKTSSWKQKSDDLHR